MFEHFAFISDLAGDFYCDVSQNALWVPVVVILGTAYVFILYNLMIIDVIKLTLSYLRKPLYNI